MSSGKSLSARFGAQLARVIGTGGGSGAGVTGGTRLARFVVGLMIVTASGSALAACGASAGDLARASCKHVTTSLGILTRAGQATDPVVAAKLRDQAYLALLPAVPIAAQASYHDITWQALSTTLSEVNRVPESELAASLRAQCQRADTSVFNQTPPPSSPSGG